MTQIADMTAKAVSPDRIRRVSADLENWETLAFEDRRLVADTLIAKVRATDQEIQIEWII